MSDTADLPFLVAGGGIAGLAAALGLSRTGRPSRLFEQAAAFEEVGAGLQMSPNGVRALQWLGAWDAVEPACVIPTEIHVRSGGTGRLLQRIRLGKPFEERFGAPYRVCHRADLLAGLVSAARASARIELNTGARARAAETTADGARLILESGETLRGTAVIAADGLRSRLRQAVSGKTEPAFRGHAIYRGLIAFDHVPSTIEADCVTLWLWRGGHVVHYPVSNWRSFNIVAAIDSAAPPEGWGRTGSGEPLRATFAEADENLLSLLTVPDHWLVWQGADLPDLSRWSNGNIVLAGDAAHATLPYLAQGAVMGLEDACSLAGHLAERASAAEAFSLHAASRQPRTSRIQAQSRRLGQIYHAAGLKALARDLALAALGQDAAIRRNAWIYDWKP